MKELLQSVLNGEQNQVKLPYTPPANVLSILEELGTKDMEDLATNGWNYDFWMGFKYKEKEYMFTGSWYYGNYIFSKK